MYHFCTYFDRRYLARGLALYNSLRRHAEPFVLYVLCFDHYAFEALSRLELPQLRPISLQEFEGGDDALLKAKQDRSTVEYYFTCTPSLPLYILNNFPDVDVVSYLDADLYFYSSPAPIYEELGERSILIVGHRYPDRMRDLEIHGIYNVGLVAFRNDSQGRACLDWWRGRCLDWCFDRVESGRFADQKYLDNWPTLFPGVVVLQHKGAGLAPWNVERYTIREQNSSVLVDSQPLIFYHFHGLRQINHFLFNHGLGEYGVSLSGALRSRVYVPYLHELQKLVCQTSSGPASVLRGNQSFGGRELVKLLLYGRVLLVVGPLNTEVHLGPIARPLLYLTALARGRSRLKQLPG